MHYEEKGRGEVLVLLHAFPVDARMWESQIEFFSRSHRVIAPDFRGFGRSPRSGPVTIESLAEDVHSLMIELNGFPITLAGLSMGGYVALAYARKYPQTLRGLILIDTKADADSPEAREGRGKMIELAREKGSAAVGDAMQPKLLSPDAIAHKPDVVRRLRKMIDAPSPQTIEWALAAMRDRRDQTEMLPLITTPTLLIFGELDSVTPPSIAEQMKREIPGSQLMIIPDCGHLSALEQPEKVNEAIQEFMLTL